MMYRKLFKYDLVQYGREKFFYVLALFVATVILGLMVNLFSGTFEGVKVVAVSFLIIFISVYPIIGSCYLASHFGYMLRTKTRRLNYLMIPAPTHEKFIVRFVDSVILPTVVMVVSFLLAAIVILPFSQLTIADMYNTFFGNSAEQMVIKAELMKNISLGPYVSMIITAIHTYFTFLVVMMLGSMIFKSYAYVKTLLSLFILELVLSASRMIVFEVNDNDYMLLMWQINGFCLVISLISIGVSYYLFSKKQIV